MYCYKLVIAYDGTAYHGWQEQAPGVKTIVSTLKQSFARTFMQPVPYLVGASRTDAGVHALGQVARIKLPFFIDAEQLRIAWNRTLPPDIMIRTIVPTTEVFHPQHQCAYKEYWYHFFMTQPLPPYARYGWFIDKPVDCTTLNEALTFMIGTHDFRSFITGDDEETIRTINALYLDYQPHSKLYRIRVIGSSFARYMIRRIVGAAITIASRRSMHAAHLRDVLHARSARQDLLTAPAHGLTLRRIVYDNSLSMKETV